MIDICDNLSNIFLTQFPTLKNAKLGWPDRKFFQVEHNLPAIFFVDISEKSERAVSQLLTHRTTSSSIIQEKMRVHTMVQMSLFTNNKLTRDQLGWGIKQYLVTNFHIPVYDFTQATPVNTGEYFLFNLVGDHREEKGEANCWQRDLTFTVQSRILDALTAYPVSQIIDNQTTEVGTKSIQDQIIKNKGE